jgi:omega-6 fatty acid desaturase (delta-12 desaturase)
MTQNTASSPDLLDEEQLPSLRDLSRKFETPSVPRATWQLLNTLVPYFGLWVAMYFARSAAWWVMAPMALLAGMLLVRAFIIFHDCGHGSFFPSKTANTIVGWVTGILTFTPYHHWRREHSIHHATSGNLDERGTGDIWTLTVREYLALSGWKKLAYRLVRNPLVLFGLGPLFIFIVWQRFAPANTRPRELREVHLTNLALLLIAIGGSWLFGWKTYLVLQLSVMMVAGGLGLWMFYVQHQFEDGYWEGDSAWDYTAAAMAGSSYYKLPRILQWFSGNIGFHHIHHLNSRIPNYNLAHCHAVNPEFQKVKPVTLVSSLRTLRLRLWDEERRTMVGYSALRRRHARKA